MKNEEFICENCGKKNEPHKSSCRNHCKHCLYSKHVDEDIPGDRKSTCKSLMKPISIEMKNKEYIIMHECNECGKKIPNTASEDDNFDQIIKLSTDQWKKMSY